MGALFAVTGGASGGAGTLYYAYDAMVGITSSNIIVDNGANALPMRRGSVSVA